MAKGPFMQKPGARSLVQFVVIAAAAAVLVYSFSPRALMSSLKEPARRSAVPDFSLPAVDGAGWKLSEHRGQVVVVNFWATWCPPCRAEMQSIEKVYQEYKDQGFTVLAVNMTYQDDALAVVPFMNEQGLTFPILLDETGDMANAYQLRSLPSSYFIRRDGIIHEIVIGGPMSEALLRTRIEAILR